MFNWLFKKSFYNTERTKDRCIEHYKILYERFKKESDLYKIAYCETHREVRIQNKANKIKAKRIKSQKKYIQELKKEIEILRSKNV